MDVEARLRKNPNVTYRRLAEGEGGVLLHLETGQYHGIDEIGCLIWTQIDGDRTAAEVVEAVRAEVADPPPELDADVLEFLEGMRSRDLVV